jgi:hypothetical protein
MPKTRVAMSPSAADVEWLVFPRWWKVLAAAAFFGLGALFIPSHDLFSRCARYFALGMVGLLVAVCALRVIVRQHVRVTADHLIIPRSHWSRAELVLPFVKLGIIGRGFNLGHLRLRFYDGLDFKEFVLDAETAPSKEVFARACELIEERIQDARRRAPPVVFTDG